MTDNTDSAYFLVTTAIEEFWDTSKPTLFLGDWCRLYSRRSHWEQANGQVIHNVWDSNQKLYDASDYIIDLRERLLPALANALNIIHKANYSIRYWRIIIGPWLELYLPILYDRYVSLRSALDRYPNLTTTILAEACWITPVDTLEFVQLAKEDAYNLQIYSRILTHMGKRFPSKAAGVRLTAPIVTSAGIRAFAKKHAKKLAVAISRINKEGHVIIFRNSYFPAKVDLQLIFRTFGRVWPIISPSLQLRSIELDKGTRSRLENLLPHKTQFEELLNKILPFDIPQSCIEGYGEVNSAIQKSYPHRPGAILSANDWHYDEVFKQWAAGASESGSLLLGVQHGGNYGSLAYHPFENHEIAITDRFFTWGWDRIDLPEKIHPMPSSMLVGRKPMKADSQKNGILFLTTTWPRYLFHFPLTPVRFQQYLQWQLRFAKKLSPQLLTTLRVRCHQEDRGWDIAQRWKDSYSEITIEKWDISLLQSLNNCRLYVCDHLSTTFIEALSADKPSILFWDPDINELRPEAKTYYDRLREAKILYDTPEAAANAVNLVHDDIESWWNEPGRQAARRSFCDRFARTSPTAVSEWVNEFREIAKEVH